MANPKPSGFANTLAGKVAILERTKELIKSTNLLMAVPAQGITKEQVDLLRKDLPTTTKASVVKNSLMRKAIEGTKFEAMTDSLTQQNMFLFIQEGESKSTYDSLKKWQKEVKRTDESCDAKVAVLENVAYTGKRIDVVVSLPTKKELITKIAQGIKAVPTKLARGIKAVPEKLGRAVRAVKEQKEKDATPPASDAPIEA